jgi:hypothetical protein
MQPTQSIQSQVEAAGGQQAPQPLTVKTPRGKLVVDVAAQGTIGLSFRRLTYSSPSLQSLSMSDLQEACCQLAERLTYLLEPIRVIESDAGLQAVQMRSDPPGKEEDSVSYFELLAQRCGQFQLIRYRKTSRQPRENIASDVTFQVLERLAHDFDELCGP